MALPAFPIGAPVWLHWVFGLVLLGTHATTAAQPLPAEGSDSSGHGAGIGQQCSGLLLVDRPPNRQWGLFSDIGCDDCATSDDNAQIVAQHVELDVAASITEIVVWGGFWPDDDPVPDNWTVIIHDDAPYQPGQVIYSESPVAALRQTTGEAI